MLLLTLWDLSYDSCWFVFFEEIIHRAANTLFSSNVSGNIEKLPSQLCPPSFWNLKSFLHNDSLESVVQFLFTILVELGTFGLDVESFGISWVVVQDWYFTFAKVVGDLSENSNHRFIFFSHLVIIQRRNERNIDANFLRNCLQLARRDKLRNLPHCLCSRVNWEQLQISLVTLRKIVKKHSARNGASVLVNTYVLIDLYRQ